MALPEGAEPRTVPKLAQMAESRLTEELRVVASRQPVEARQKVAAAPRRPVAAAAELAARVWAAELPA